MRFSFSRHYAFGENRKSRRVKLPETDCLGDLETLITSSSNEVGAHLLFNGNCDVIGKRVFDIIAESIDLEISYFCHYPKEIRPIHCAILLRNERVVKCLIEEHLKFKKIKNNDSISQKALRSAILRMVRSNIL